MGKIVTLRQLLRIRRALARKHKSVVFTNGTFDILHRGHVEYLAAARALGDVLVVGLNTDASIRRIKGNGRPINRNADRAAVLAALQSVDYVCFFGANTPGRLIEAIVPDVLVKGADWKLDAIVGRDVVERHGGRVERIRLVPGRSSTAVIERIINTYLRLPKSARRNRRQRGNSR
jgi:D-beta-D-heptose 7-phosphate kinase/D-beta-D-heptose 1-phosphate adenosyltransferase